MSKNNPDFTQGYTDAVLNRKPSKPDNKDYMNGYRKAVESEKKWNET